MHKIQMQNGKKPFYNEKRTEKIGYDIFMNVGNTHIKPTIGKYDETRQILS